MTQDPSAAQDADQAAHGADPVDAPTTQLGGPASPAGPTGTEASPEIPPVPVDAAPTVVVPAAPETVETPSPAAPPAVPPAVMPIAAPPAMPAAVQPAEAPTQPAPAPETSEGGWGPPAANGSPPPGGPKRWLLVLTSVLAAAALVLAGVLGFLLVGKTHKDAGQLPGRGRDALVVATRFAGNVTTYDYHQLTDDFARVLADSAGKFKDDFAKTTAASGQFIKLVQTYKGIAKGEVSDVALERLDGDTAVVVMLVTQTVQNSNRPAPQVTRTDGRITLTRIHGHWFVTDFKVV